MAYQRVLTIDGRRTGYSVEQILKYTKTLTVGQLKELLNGYDDDMPIMLKNDNGYTYGEIEHSSFDMKSVKIDDEEED